MLIVLDIKLYPHEIEKLRRFTDSANITYHIDFMSDLTDILKGMMLSARNYSNVSSEAFDAIIKSEEASFFSVFGLLKLPFQMATTVILVKAVGFLIRSGMVSNLKAKMSWQMSVSGVLLIMFSASVINNHNYLTQVSLTAIY
jgi:hypothetical protein